jgi:hypothetical protein
VKWQVSTEGGRGPRFRSDGRQLFYRNGDNMMAVDIDSSEELVLGKPVLLFERALAEYGSAPPAYDVAPDGRFVMVEEGQSEPPPTRLNIVLNWGEELKRRVPPN